MSNLMFYNNFLFLCAWSAAGHRMWALQRLRKLLTTEYGQSININRLLGDSEGEARSMVRQCTFLYCMVTQYICMCVNIIRLISLFLFV